MLVTCVNEINFLPAALDYGGAHRAANPGRLMAAPAEHQLPVSVPGPPQYCGPAA